METGYRKHCEPKGATGKSRGIDMHCRTLPCMTYLVLCKCRALTCISYLVPCKYRAWPTVWRGLGRFSGSIILWDLGIVKKVERSDDEN